MEKIDALLFQTSEIFKRNRKHKLVSLKLGERIFKPKRFNIKISLEFGTAFHIKYKILNILRNFYSIKGCARKNVKISYLEVRNHFNEGVLFLVYYSLRSKDSSEIKVQVR